MKEWFTIAELAELKLPDMPTSPSKIQDLALRMEWRSDDRCRKLERRGGGFEYHVSVLPPLARAKLARIAAVEQSREESRQARRALYWRVFEAMPEEHRQIAHRRHALIIAAEKAIALSAASVGSVEAALAPVLKKHGVSASSYYDLRKSISDVEREDWLPALAPKYEDGTTRSTADCHPEAWAAMKSDYLRPEQPRFSAVYRRVVQAAKRHGWSPIPTERTLRRRMEAEVPRAVQVLTRQGRRRAEQLYPAQIRTKSHLHAMEITNTDGHQLDLFVSVPWQELPARVTLLGIQDIFSSKILSWRLAESETWHVVRACIGDMIELHGIPDHLYMDNGRAFASKKISGGAVKRNRFKIDEQEVAGLLTTLGIEPHFTKPYSGQSKPIERAWRDLAEEISKHPAMSGCYTGNKPDAKPENYRSRAIPLEELERHVADRIAEHNARTGRRAETAKGRSFDQTFEESMRHPATIVRRPTEAQRVLWLLAAETVRTRKKNGEIHYKGNVYWHEALTNCMGVKVTIRFDPEKLHAPMRVYDADGRFLCEAACTDRAGFNDSAAAGRQEKNRRTFRKRQKALADIHRTLSAEQLADLYRNELPAEPKAPVRPTITRIVTGNLAFEADAEIMTDEEFEAGISRSLSSISGDSSIIQFPRGNTGRKGSASGRTSRAE